MIEGPEEQSGELPRTLTTTARIFALARSGKTADSQSLARRETRDSLVAGAATRGADAVSYMREIFRVIVDRLRTDADTIINVTPRKPLPRFIRLVTREMVIDCLSAGRKLRIFDRVPIHQLSDLLDDRDENFRLKADIVDDLDSRIGAYLPFVDELEHIARNCFDRGIPAEKLIGFIESEQILTMLIKEVLNLHHSRYRSGSVMSILSSGFDSVVQKLHDISARNSKAPVEGDIEDTLKRHVEYFKDHYNPRDIKYTVANFVKELREIYPEYDVLSWLDQNKNLLIEILRGDHEEDKTTSSGPRHIANIIKESYERRGRENPERFIALNIPGFLQYQSETDATFIEKELRRLQAPPDSPFFELDIEWLHSFFEETIPRIQSHNLGLAHLQKMIIDQCEQHIIRTNPRAKVLVIMNTDSHHNIQGYNSNQELRSAVEDLIKRNTRVISSHVDVVNLLADPEEMSPEVRQNYIDWFDGQGNLRRGVYYEYLRRIFGHSTREDGEPQEEFLKVKKRVEEILQEVNAYLDSISTDLGIPSFVASDRVKNANDYADLIKIANESDSKEERFAARRKIELAILTYSCLQTPRMVYRDRDAEEIKKTLQSNRGPLTISDTEPLKEVRFIDAANGDVSLIQDDSQLSLGDEPIKSVNLIPAKFAGIDCYLLPTKEMGDEMPRGEKEYLGKKRLYNVVTKLIHRDQMRAKDVTDLIRMTFVVDSPDKLLQLQEYLETNFISFGRTLRRENRYGEFVKVSSFSVGASNAKSDEYRSLRYVVDIPVWDQTGDNTYFAPLEIRILLTEDCIREKSTHHHASHKRYEERRLRSVTETIAPPQIHPELYKTVGPDPVDIFKRQKTVLKDRNDFANAA